MYEFVAGNLLASYSGSIVRFIYYYRGRQPGLQIPQEENSCTRGLDNTWSGFPGGFKALEWHLDRYANYSYDGRTDITTCCV